MKNRWYIFPSILLRSFHFFSLECFAIIHWIAMENRLFRHHIDTNARIIIVPTILLPPSPWWRWRFGISFLRRFHSSSPFPFAQRIWIMSIAIYKSNLNTRQDIVNRQRRRRHLSRCDTNQTNIDEQTNQPNELCLFSAFFLFFNYVRLSDSLWFDEWRVWIRNSPGSSVQVVEQQETQRKTR